MAFPNPWGQNRSKCHIGVFEIGPNPPRTGLPSLVAFAIFGTLESDIKSGALLMIKMRHGDVRKMSGSFPDEIRLDADRHECKIWVAV
jgi:hypothetical protein